MRLLNHITILICHYHSWTGNAYRHRFAVATATALPIAFKTSPSLGRSARPSKPRRGGAGRRVRWTHGGHGEILGELVVFGEEMVENSGEELVVNWGLICG